MDRDAIIQDLTPFCDIGSGSPKVTERQGKFTIQLLREGRNLRISLERESGAVRTKWGDSAERGHVSFAAMLASEVFANLRKWSDSQRELLKRDAITSSRLIPVVGVTHDERILGSIEEMDHLVGATLRRAQAVEILLVDGPAGIGKTNLIEQLAYRRADNYKVSARPLILHVKSRGRVLSNLQDLMAFSLQTLRSSITYDQIPVLAKHGLVVVAIDGFDELGDPNGYESAWGQLGELVTTIRGAGTLILAGRDTFIGRDRLFKDVKALREMDLVNGLTLAPPTPEQAKTWLKTIHQWTDVHLAIPAVAVLFEKGSFALRPVFLKLLGEHIKPKDLKDHTEAYLTQLLVNHMIKREAALFGKAVDAVMSRAQIELFVFNFLKEVARDMADSQSESVDATSLSWIAEAALGDGVAADILGLIKNRAAVIAFLMPDERPGFRTFVHTYLLNFFLAHVSIESIANGDFPKYVRRNILASEFLSVFIEVASAESSTDRFQSFISRGLVFAATHTHVDRGIRNVGALLFASLPYFPSDSSYELENVQIDDAVLRGTCPAVKIRGVVVNQLDCRSADMSCLAFENSSVVRLIADDLAVFSPSFPIPSSVTEGAGNQLSEMSEIESWLGARGHSPKNLELPSVVPAALKKHPVYRLLGKACRLRQYWLRAENDQPAAKVLGDQNWPSLHSVLRQYDLVREETAKQASGKASAFVHIKHKEWLLSENSDDPQLADFFRTLALKVGLPNA